MADEGNLSIFAGMNFGCAEREPDAVHDEVDQGGTSSTTDSASDQSKAVKSSFSFIRQIESKELNTVGVEEMCRDEARGLESEDDFTSFYSQHSSKLTQLSDEKNEVKNQLYQAYQQVKDQLISDQEHLASLRVKLEQVLLDEDYDQAAEISDNMEQLTCERYELQNTWPNLMNSKVKRYFNEVSAFKNKQAAYHKLALSKHDELERQQNQLLTEYRSKSTVQLDTRKESVKRQQDELRRSLEDLQLDKDYINKDRKELDRKVEAKVEVFQRRKDELVKEQENLEREIEMLEKRMRELKNEKQKVEDEINEEENKMEEVRKEFGFLETRFLNKSDAIQKKEQTLKDKLNDVALQEKSLEDICSQNKNKEENLVKNINDIENHKRESRNKVEKCQDKIDRKILEIFLIDICGSQGETLKKLQTIEKEKAAKLQDCELVDLEQKIKTRRKRLGEVENQIPEFKQSKKLAATQHNFKEAKRLNDIIKQLAHEVETCKEELVEMENSLKEKQSEAMSLKDEFEAARRDASIAIENHKTDVFLRVIRKMKELIDEKERMKEDDFLEHLRQTKLDLLKTELRYLNKPTEDLSDIDQQRLDVVKDFMENEDSPSEPVLNRDSPLSPERDSPLSPEGDSPTEPPLERDSPPRPERDSPPRPERDSPPPPERDSPPRPERDSPPRPERDSPPRPERDSPPRPERDSPPRPERDSPPRPERDSPPRPERDSPPRPERDPPPPPEGDSPPRPAEGDSPLPSEGDPPPPPERYPPPPPERYPPLEPSREELLTLLHQNIIINHILPNFP